MPCGRQLLADRAREHAHAALGGRVRRVVEEGDVLVDRGHVDDAPAAAGVDHELRGGLRREERALEVDAEHQVVVLLADVHERLADLDAGVVDEDVEAAERRVRIAHELLGLRGHAHVGAQRDRRPAQLVRSRRPPAALRRRRGGSAPPRRPPRARSAGRWPRRCRWSCRSRAPLLPSSLIVVPPFRAQPANACVGRPATPASRRSRAPARGCAASSLALRPSRRVVTYRSRRSVAAEAAAGDARDRELHDRRQLAVRRVAAQSPAAVERDPDAALGVDGQAVGDGALDLDGGEGPPVLERSRRRVAVEHVDAAGRDCR